MKLLKFWNYLKFLSKNVRHLYFPKPFKKDVVFAQIHPKISKQKIYTFLSIQASMNPEDIFFNKNFEVKLDDDVERVRRAHLNDLENIVPFIIICFLFVLSEPNEMFAGWLIRVVGISRIAHSIVYLSKVRQPFRAICFYFMYVPSLYMVLSSIVYFIKLWKDLGVVLCLIF